MHMLIYQDIYTTVCIKSDVLERTLCSTKWKGVNKINYDMYHLK